MGLLKQHFKRFLNPEKDFEEIENEMRKSYDLISKNYLNESNEMKLKMTLKSRYRKWSEKEIELFFNDYRIGVPPYIDKLLQKIVQNEKGQLIGWNRKGITKEGEFIIKKYILYKKEKGATLEEAVEEAEEVFNSLCREYNPLMVKNLMKMMPNVLHSVDWHK